MRWAKRRRNGWSPSSRESDGRHPARRKDIFNPGAELSVPVDLDIASCDRGQYRSWTEWEVVDGANAHHVPGQVDVVYMLDVDRRPFVIDATYRLESTAADRAELDAVLASMFMW